MATVYQNSLFTWEDINDLGDLERFQLVLDYLPGQKLIGALYQHRAIVYRLMKHLVKVLVACEDAARLHLLDIYGTKNR